MGGYKQPVDIERLLQWAYRDELPKREIGGLTGWEADILVLGTRIDKSHDEPGFPVSLGAPHNDALLLDHAVRSLDPVTVKWPSARGILMGDLALWLGDRDPMVSAMKDYPAALVAMHAKMGSRPQWDMGSTSVRPVLGKNHKPVIDGITAGRRYGEGATCRLRLEPPPQEIASARFEYFVWRAAMVSLAESCKLQEHEARHPAAPATPWLSRPRATTNETRRFAPRYRRLTKIAIGAC